MLTLTFDPVNPKSIGFLLSSSSTYMWGLIVIGQNLQSVSCPQGFIDKVPMLTLTFDPVAQNLDPKLIGFLLSLWTTYMWSLIVIEQKL